MLCLLFCCIYCRHIVSVNIQTSSDVQSVRIKKLLLFYRKSAVIKKAGHSEISHYHYMYCFNYFIIYTVAIYSYLSVTVDFELSPFNNSLFGVCLGMYVNPLLEYRINFAMLDIATVVSLSSRILQGGVASPMHNYLLHGLTFRVRPVTIQSWRAQSIQ